MALTLLTSFGWSGTLLTAAAENTKSIQNMHAPLPALQSAKKLDATSSNETILSDDRANLPKHMTSQNIDILSSYGVNMKDDVKSVNKVKDNRNGRIFSEVQYDTGCSVGFDDDNNIISISNFKGKSTSSETNSEITLSSKVNLNDMIDTIETNFKLKQ